MPVLLPWILTEALPDLISAGGVKKKHDIAAVLKQAREHDEAFGFKSVHEVRMGGEARLFVRRLGLIPEFCSRNDRKKRPSRHV
jgi:hypothetical protein